MRTKTTVFQIADDFDIHSKVFTEDGLQVKDITLEWDGFLSGEGYELRLSDGSNRLVMPHYFVYVDEE